jgi:hypothetical protein
MRPVIYAIAIVCMVACVTSNAAPMAPIPTVTVPNADSLIQVGYYYRGRYYPYPRHAHYYHRGYYARPRTYSGHGLSLPMLENVP